MRSGIQGLLFPLSFVLFFILSNAKGNNLFAADDYSRPSEIQSPYKYTLSLGFRISNDSMYIQFRARRTNTIFSFGNSDFVINVDTSLFDVQNAKITKRGAWDAANDANYGSITLTSNLTLRTLGIRVVRRTIGGTSTSPVPTNDALIAEIYVPAKKCRGLTILSYRTTANGINVSNWLGENITDDKSLNSALAYNTTCPCSAYFKGIDSNYCTAGLYSKLSPKTNGGTFSGPGVNYSSGIWYFKPFDAGPGKHNITYVINTTTCKDTVSIPTVVNAAPCITTAGKDSSSGFTYLPIPQGIYTDCNGQVYTTSALEHKVYQLDTFGIKHSIGGTGLPGYLDGPLNTSLFDTPTGVAVDNTSDTNVYVIDSRNFCIRKINVRLKTVSTFVGTPKVIGAGNTSDDGIGLASKFIKAVGIAFSTDYKKLYISENDISKTIQRIRVIDIATRTVTTIAGGGQGDNPIGGGIVAGLSAKFTVGNISCDKDYLYFADPTNNKIRKIDLNSSSHGVQTIVGTSKGFTDGDSINAKFDQPFSATVGVNGNIYVADKNNNLIREVTQYPKKFVRTISGFLVGGNSDTTYTLPVATSVFVKGFIDVADVGNDRIRRIAIQDYGNQPYAGFDSIYCYNDPPDTLNYVVGSYSGPGVYQSGGRWLFDPKKVTPGDYTICYSYDLNSCNATFCKSIKVNPIPRPKFGKITNVCQTSLDSFQLDAGIFKTYQWYEGQAPAGIIVGQTKRFYLVKTPAIYSVIVTDTNGCTGGDTTSIQIIPVSPITLGQDKYLCAGTTAELNFSPTANVQTVLWQDSTSQLTDTAYGGGVYFVTVKYTNGCFASDTLNIFSQLPPTPLISSFPIEKCVSFVKTHSVFAKENTFLTPQLQGMVRDKAGNIFITDYENNLIRKVDLLGNKTIYAGLGTDEFGTDIGTVKLKGPYGIAIDRMQNIYITEVKANIVRKISPAGKVSIFAGVYGSTSFNGDGKKDKVALSQPTGIDLDDQGNVYITEYAKNIIRKISPLGFTTIIGDTTTSGNSTGNYFKARFNKPQALTIDKGGFVYVADLNNNIKKIDPFTKSVTVYSNITGVSSINIKGLAVDNHKRMYFTMNSNYSLYYIDPRDSTTGYYAGVINSSGSQDGLMSQSQFQDLQGVYIDENGGALFAVDKDRIRMVTDSCSVDICEESVAKLDVGSGYFSHEWNNDPALNTRYLDVSTKNAYFVKVTNANYCPFYDTIHVNVYPKPVFKTSNDTIICKGASVSLIASITPANANDTINWKLNGTIIKQTVGLSSNVIMTSQGGNYTAEVITGQNCSYSRSVKVTIDTPAVNAGPDQIFCTLETINLSAITTPSASNSFKYKWSGANISNDTIFNPIAAPSQVNDSIYIVEVVDGLGCKASDSLIIHLRKSPTIKSIADSTICEGTALVLNTDIIGGNSPYDFTWIPNNGLNSSKLQNPTATPLSATQYLVSATDLWGCESNVDTVNIKILNLDLKTSISMDTVCPFVQASLDVIASNGSGNFKYVWTPTGSLNNPSLKNPTAKTNISTQYAVKVTDTKYGCQSTAYVKLNVKELFIDAGQDTSICFGNFLNLASSISGGDSPFKYTWSPSTNLNDVHLKDPVLSPSAPGITKYLVEVEDKNGCKNRDSIIVKINPNPVIQAGKDTLICSNTSVDLIANASNGSSPYNISWRDIKNNILFSNSIAVNLKDAAIFEVSVIDANLCIGIQDSIVVNVSNIEATAEANLDTICPNTIAYLQVSALGGMGSFSYQWFPAVGLNNATIASPSTNISKTTIFNVEITDSLGCKDTSSVIIYVIDLKVNTGPDLQFCKGDSAILNAVVTGGKSPYQYSWSPTIYLNSDNIANPTATPPEGTQRYIVNVKDAGGCEKQDTILTNVTPLPIANAGLDTLEICNKQSIQVGGSPAVSGGSGSPYQIRWFSKTESPESISDAAIGNPFVKPGASAQYFLVATDIKECTSVDTVFILVNKLPATNISQNKLAECENDTVVLSVDPYPGTYTFQWLENRSLAMLGVKDHVKVVKDGSYKIRIKDVLTGCADSSVIQLDFIDLPEDMAVLPYAASCLNIPITLVGTATGDQLSYSWSTPDGRGQIINPGVNKTIYIPDRTNDPLLPSILHFQFKVENTCGKDSLVQEIGLNPYVTPSFIPSLLKAFPDDTISFTNTTDTVAQSVQSFYWFFGDGNSQSTFNAMNVYKEGGLYNASLVAINYLGCADTAVVPIEILNTQILYIPNAFSPSEISDNNKVLKVYGQNLSTENFEFNIFNRWGESVFISNDLNVVRNIGWNGNFKNNGAELPMGVYTYSLKARFKNGSQVNRTGTITLIR